MDMSAAALVSCPGFFAFYCFREEERMRGLQVGTLIGSRYRIVHKLGAGGMSSVYAAEDLQLGGKLRAVKVAYARAEDYECLAQEAGLLMALNHPQLPVITDFVAPNEEGIMFMVTDYVEGENLQHYFERNAKKLHMDDILRIAMQLCAVLDYLHRQSPPVIHRDLKPANVMLDRSGHLKLIDLGIARTYKFAQAGDTLQLGTPGFAAPEQAESGQSDARADIYGLGALLFYLLSGGQYYRATYPLQAGVLGREGAQFIPLLERMLDVRAERRFASVREADEALSTIAARSGHHAHAPRPGSGSLHYRSRPGSGQRTCVIAALSSGSGATFVAITLAKLLGSRRLSCCAIEHAVNEPEWHALLRSGAAAPLPELPPGAVDLRLSAAHTVWQEGTICWQALYPQQAATDGKISNNGASVDAGLGYVALSAAASREGSQASGWAGLAGLSAGNCPMGQWQSSGDHLNAEAVIYDLSGRFDAPECRALLEEADDCYFVADPLPAKWTPARLSLARQLSDTRRRAGRHTGWIANKDMPFRYRSEWLSLLPEPPEVIISQLTPEKWMQSLWSGKWATDNRGWNRQLSHELKPLWSRFLS
ncbi:serine/threonine protein kinase [Paenibacillaceae bacterium]|nr:serine/threonine protein kinase [Paenibacillaceae bacterium]